MFRQHFSVESSGPGFGDRTEVIESSRVEPEPSSLRNPPSP
jgi:hypothetical protein